VIHNVCASKSGFQRVGITDVTPDFFDTEAIKCRSISVYENADLPTF
jgi:hypothetical protein